MKQPGHNSNLGGDGLSHSPAFFARESAREEALSLGLIGLVFFCAHQVGFFFRDPSLVLAPVWFADGIGVAVLLLSPQRRWRSIVIVLAVVGTLANLLAHTPWLTNLGFVVANTFEAYAGAWLMTHWCGDRITFYRTKEVLAWVVATAIVTVMTGLTAAITRANLDIPYWKFFQSWIMADGLGTFLATPLIMTWAAPDNRSKFAKLLWSLETLAVVAISLGFTWAYFWQSRFKFTLMPHSYMLMAPLAWAALRLGPKGVISIQAALAMVEFGSSASGHGFFPLGGDNQTERILWVQLFLGVTGCIALLLAANTAEHYSTEQSLREAEASLRALADNLPNGMVYQVVLEPDGSTRFLHLSAGVQRLNGLSAEDVLRDASVFHNQVLEEDQPKIVAARNESLKFMSFFSVEVRIRRPDGQIRWMHLCSAPRRLSDGRVIWDGIETDITEQKEIEGALRESEGRYRSLIEQAPIGISLFDRNRIVYANAEATRIMGAKNSAELLGRAPMEFVQPETRESMLKRIEGMFIKGDPAPPLEWKLQQLSGAEIDVESRGIPIVHDGKPMFQSMVVDISKRKQAEELVRRQLAFDEVIKGLLARFASSVGSEIDGEIRTALRQLAEFVSIEHAFIGLASPDRSTWSAAYEWGGPGSSVELYQNVPVGTYLKEPWAVFGQTFFMQSLKDIPPEYAKLREELAKRGFESILEIPVQGRGGAMMGFMALNSKSPKSWRPEDIKRLQMAANAIAHALERKRAEEHLESSREQLRALTARLQSLREEERTRIARDLHDHLGQLLTALSLDLKSVERKAAGVTDTALRSALHAKIGSARQLADETQISVQKIAAELRPAVLEKIGLEEAIRDEARAFETRTSVLCHLNMPSESVPAPMEHATACFRIFQEVLTNVARHAKAKNVTIHLRHDSERILMQVSDDGVGIRAEHLQNQKSLGLLGMMERAEMLGGFTAFGPRPGTGTTVTVSIPLKRKPALSA